MDGVPDPGSILDKLLDKVVQTDPKLIGKRVIRQGVQMPVAFRAASDKTVRFQFTQMEPDQGFATLELSSQLG
ncbi:hypothetical protein GCM10027185_55920 [Spirosoma pulveris]